MQGILSALTHFPWRRIVVLLCIALILPFSAQLYAQPDVRTFPETGHTLRGAFRFFWETNGGLPIFGYPITEEYNAPDTGRLTQYFERARFELVQQDGTYTVELGMLGVEYTFDRIFPKSPPIQNTATRRYIPQTQHVIQHGFKEVWETRGAERIFGWPISEEIDEVLEDGKWHTVQYFERVRFEYWPTFPPGQRVLISTLGRVFAPSVIPSVQVTSQPMPSADQGTPQPPSASTQPTVSVPPTPYPTASPWPTLTPWPTTPPPSSVCCRVCTTGKACGNSCIARDKTCNSPPGCACDG